MWPEYEDASQKYIYLQAPNVRALQAYRASKVDFWLNLIPELTEFSQCDEDGEVPDDCDGVVLGGAMGITASEAGAVIVVLLILLGVVGLLCIVLVAVACGYRDRSKTLLRTQMRDTEMGQQSWKKASASLPSTIAVSVPFPMDDLPPPSPPPMDTEDTKPLIPDSPALSESPEVEAPPTQGADNEAQNDDEEVRQALQHMDAVVENADTASVDLGNGGKPSDAPMEDTDQKPKMAEEKEAVPQNEEPAAEDEAPKNEEPAVEGEAPKNEEAAVGDDVPVPEKEEGPAKTEPEETPNEAEVP